MAVLPAAAGIAATARAALAALATLAAATLMVLAAGVALDLLVLLHQHALERLFGAAVELFVADVRVWLSFTHSVHKSTKFARQVLDSDCWAIAHHR